MRILLHYQGEVGVSKPSVCNGLTHIEVANEDPYSTRKVLDKIKEAQGLGIAYDPDSDALGVGGANADANVIMSVQPLGEEELQDIRIDDPVVSEGGEDPVHLNATAREYHERQTIQSSSSASAPEKNNRRSVIIISATFLNIHAHLLFIFVIALTSCLLNPSYSSGDNSRHEPTQRAGNTRQYDFHSKSGGSRPCWWAGGWC